MSDGLDVRYQRDSNVVYREIAEERILVPIRKQVADMACIYVLNETGARIWELMDGQRSLAEIRDALVHEYEVGEEKVTSDLLEVVGDLSAAGVVRKSEHAV